MKNIGLEKTNINTNSSLLREIKNLTREYREEITKLENQHNTLKEQINKSIKYIKSDDFSNELCENYIKMADVLIKIVDDLTNVQSSFPLDGDYVSDAKSQINSIKPRVRLNKSENTASWANLIQKETVDIISRLERCKNYDELLVILEQLYQNYVDAIYIKNNIITLLKESGLYQKEVSDLLNEQQTKLSNEEHEYIEKSKKENLKVFPKMQELKEELANIRAIEKDYRLNSENIEFGNGYDDSFLMGTYITKPVEEEVIAFSKKYLNDDLHSLNIEKLIWKLDNEHSTLIFDLPSAVLAQRSESKFFEYIEQLLFTFISSLPVRKIQLAGIDSPNPNSKSISSPFVPIMQRAEKYLGSNIMYAPIVRDKNKVADLIDSLFVEGQKRSDTYFSEGYDDIYNYNCSIIDNQHDFKFLFINNYPYGFEDQETITKLQSIIKDNATGIITIVFQAKEKDIYEAKKSSYSNEKVYTYLDYKELGANYLTDFDFNEKKFRYGDISGSFEIKVPNFDNSKYWENINKGYQNTNVLYIDALLKQVEKANDISQNKYSIYDHKLRIPIGKENGNIYDFTINVKNDSSAIILGTTGSGKSSLLHTIVLSAANTYSPKELKICLVDFKGADASTEFSLYKKGKELYLPHINYLSLKSTTENALDMLDMLETMQNDRMKIIARNKVANIVEYNNLPNIKNTNNVMPRILFVIDEFNTMLDGGAAKTGDSSINDIIEARIFSLLTRVRSSGITIIFSGHSTAGLNDRHMSQIKIRIGLNGFVGRLFEIKYTESDIDISNVLNEKGKSIISTDLGKSRSVVSLAYSGEMGSKRQVALAENIRQKYANIDAEFTQVVAGSTNLFSIGEMDSLKSTILNDEKIDKYSYPAYIGVTSTSSMPVSVRFSSEQSAMNYIMTGESNRLAIYERNIILGFLYMLNVRKLVTDGSCISYIRISSGIKDNNNELKDYLKYKLVEKTVSIAETEIHACEEILKVYDLYQNRLKKISNDTSPYLLVVHNVSWLNETIWFEKNEDIEPPTCDNDIINMDINNLLSSLSDDLLIEKENNNDKVFIDDKKEENDPEKAMKALTTLYSKGYMQNIFVVLASPISSDLDEFIDSTNRGNMAINYSVADNFNFYGTTNKYPSSCCHINSTKLVIEDNNNTIDTKFVSSKTRLFDYSDKTETEFLKKFNEVK